MNSDMVKQGRYLHFHNEMNTESQEDVVPGAAAAAARSRQPAELVAAVAVAAAEHLLSQFEHMIHASPLVQRPRRCGRNHRSVGRNEG